MSGEWFDRRKFCSQRILWRLRANDGYRTKKYKNRQIDFLYFIGHRSTLLVAEWEILVERVSFYDDMKVFISSLNVPIGYTSPPFPSLFWPIGPQGISFQALFLYYSWDMWKFMVFWSLIMFGGLYFITGTIAASSQLRNKYRKRDKIVNENYYQFINRMPLMEAIIIVLLYTLIGCFQGFAGGAIVGLLILSIYNAGDLTMSTWIPFVYALAQVMFNVCSSYLLSGAIL